MAVRKIFITEISRTMMYAANPACARLHVHTYACTWYVTHKCTDTCARSERKRITRVRLRTLQNWCERTCVCERRECACVAFSTRQYPSCRIDDISICRFDDRSFHSRTSVDVVITDGSARRTDELRTSPFGNKFVNNFSLFLFQVSAIYLLTNYK